jgi:PBP1b-binding outer membrane lipoprotein LpoB
MEKKLFLAAALGLLVLAGCQQSADEPKIDQNAAKAAPGADTPPVQPTAVNQAEVRSDKAGK